LARFEDAEHQEEDEDDEFGRRRRGAGHLKFVP
jgi:hypothetical protein